MNRINYRKELDTLISGLSARPRLLLHSCCAPCSSYCLVYLLDHFDITCFYYNPNITDADEYEKRASELERLVGALNEEYSSRLTSGIPIQVIRGDYEPDRFLDAVRSEDLAGCPEGGKRCEMCFSMRLKKAYDAALAGGFDYFTTTLTISPLKDADLINRIGYGIADGGNVLWLPSDFKKKDGYKQSIELSKKYGLYRQNYCGCDFSKKTREENYE
ncbi:MAG: epoxyqueuosine reductase QueH [Lachnospiraceae bacterium]|nr:epoxyqueuosine reductase QueH [Lachnospiraceae bacterium]